MTLHEKMNELMNLIGYSWQFIFSQSTNGLIVSVLVLLGGLINMKTYFVR